jgi:hypothetical protein
VLATTALGIEAVASGSRIVTGSDTATTGHTGIGPAPEQDPLQQYGYVDLDPLNDLSLALDTRGAADINLHVNSSAADTAARIMPVEYVEVSGAASA